MFPNFRMPYRWGVLLLAALALGACSTQLLTTPALDLVKQPPLTVSPPLAVEVIDAEAGERGSGYAAKLAASIRETYGDAVEIVPAGTPPRAGQATLRLHIIRLGAFFNPGGYPIIVARSQSGDVGDWAGVIAAASSAEPLAAGQRYIFLRGDWSGIADIDVELTDLRPGHHAAFTLPLSAERVAPNSLGYITARTAAATPGMR